MNDYARGRQIKLPTESGKENIKKGYRTLKSAAAGFPTIPRAMVLYRGGNEFVMGPVLRVTVINIFNKKEGPEALINKEFQSASFMSTSYDREHALNFARGAAKSVFLQLNVIPGVKAISITDRVEGETHRKEKEIIFPPNSCKMTVTNVEKKFMIVKTTQRRKMILHVQANLEQI